MRVVGHSLAEELQDSSIKVLECQASASEVTAL